MDEQLGRHLTKHVNPWMVKAALEVERLQVEREGSFSVSAEEVVEIVKRCLVESPS